MLTKEVLFYTDMLLAMFKRMLCVPLGLGLCVCVFGCLCLHMLSCTRV